MNIMTFKYDINDNRNVTNFHSISIYFLVISSVFHIMQASFNA